MFEGLVTSIKRRLSKTSENHLDVEDVPGKTGFKKSLQLWKSKLLSKSESKLTVKHVDVYDNTALSPRAAGAAACAQTEIEWPVLTDYNPNVLEKFTHIVTLSHHAHPSSYKVGIITEFYNLFMRSLCS